MTKTNKLAVKAALGVAILFALSAGSAMAGTVTSTSVSLPNGSTTINIVDTAQNVDQGGLNIITGTIGLQTTTQGALSTYCVDLFDYITPGNNAYTFNQTQLAAGQTYSNGTAPGTWTQNKVNLITALLTNGALQGTGTINTAALQIAIWDVEYDTAASNGSYNLTTHDGFYFTTTNDANSAATLAQAQVYLNAATGYQNGSAWVNATWLTNSTHVAEYLTASGTQNLVYLATVAAPEPSTVAVFGLGLIGLWAARRRKMI